MARAMSTSTSSSQTSRAVMKKMVPGLKNGMDYVQLGDSDLMVSKVCMGTMTFGTLAICDHANWSAISIHTYYISS